MGLQMFEEVLQDGNISHYVSQFPIHFVLARIQAAVFVFPGTSRKGRRVHFDQALWKQVHMLGLTVPFFQCLEVPFQVKRLSD